MSKRFYDEAHLLKAQLEWLRCEPRARAWEACCALMAAMSSRKEKNWLEAHEMTQDIEAAMQAQEKCKSKNGSRRRKALRKHIEQRCERGCGFFVQYLVHKGTTLRLNFAQSGTEMGGLVPAALVVTANLPLWDALATMDDKGPLRGEAAKREWCHKAGRQFAFQAANLECVDEESRNARVPAAMLKSDPKLRGLLRSKKPATLLEVIAALAPRAVAKECDIGSIVKAELTRVTREAKEEGDAVVFCLGSDSPHQLASKVYLRRPISDYGLRCGYLRWRASADVAWARERIWDERICLCLQMP